MVHCNLHEHPFSFSCRPQDLRCWQKETNKAMDLHDSSSYAPLQLLQILILRLIFWLMCVPNQRRVQEINCRNFENWLSRGAQTLGFKQCRSYDMAPYFKKAFHRPHFQEHQRDGRNLPREANWLRIFDFYIFENKLHFSTRWGFSMPLKPNDYVPRK